MREFAEACRRADVAALGAAVCDGGGRRRPPGHGFACPVSFDVAGAKITAVWIVRNPAKLRA